MSFKKQILGLIGWLLASVLVSVIGGLGSMNAPVFYRELNLPTWAPDAWLFGPVWTSLYTLMAIAAWLVWRQGGWENAKRALNLNLAQLAVNALWSWLFFAWYLGGVAFAEIIVLWLLIAATIQAYWKHHKVAAILLLPYLAWVTFAGALNLNLWLNNPGVL